LKENNRFRSSQPPQAPQRSNITGFTFCREWHQTSFSVNSNFPLYPIKCQLDVYGYMNTNVFVDGIGTILTVDKHFKLLIDKTTGAVYAAWNY